MSTARPYTLSRRRAGEPLYTHIATFHNYPAARKAIFGTAVQVAGTIAGVATNDEGTIIELMIIDSDRRMTEYRIEVHSGRSPDHATEG